MPISTKYRGFTLIELVVVVVVLGILAAFAIPRFASLEVQARSAAAAELAETIRSRTALAHALWLAQGKPDSVTMDGRKVEIANGYPGESSIDDMLPGFGGFAFDGSASPTVFSKTRDGEAAIPGCGVSYAGAPTAGAAPTIVLDTSGC